MAPMPRKGRLMRAISPAVAVVVMAILAACGGSDGADGLVEVTGRDYVFEGVPKTADAGAELTFTNGSEAEFHEMLVLRIVDGEERSLEELLALPEEESESLADFHGILVAMPGEDGSNPEGDGDSIVLDEPGRYAVLCFIPQGADPDALAAAMAGDSEGPPDVGDGTPHALLGMAAEIQVDG